MTILLFRGFLEVANRPLHALDVVERLRNYFPFGFDVSSSNGFPAPFDFAMFREELTFHVPPILDRLDGFVGFLSDQSSQA
jgi:hypothetical protein